MDDARRFPEHDEFKPQPLSERSVERIAYYFHNRGALNTAARNTVTSRKGGARFKGLQKAHIESVCRAWIEKLKNVLGRERFEKFRHYICVTLDYCKQDINIEVLIFLVSTAIGFVGGLAGALPGLVFIFLNRCGNLFCDCDNRRQLEAG
jgi:hypothetical protein